MDCREGGAPVGGGGGGGRVDVGDKVGLPKGIGGIPRFSGNSCDVSLEARYEVRFDGGRAEGVLGDVISGPWASVISSPDSDPGVGERMGGTGRAEKGSVCALR